MEYPEAGDPMYALAIMRKSESGGALHAALRFIVRAVVFVRIWVDHGIAPLLTVRS